MLSGKPPFHQLEPLAALFKIVTAAKPDYVLPAGISKEAQNFLELTFRKDPKQRPSARQLRTHPFCRYEDL